MHERGKQLELGKMLGMDVVIFAKTKVTFAK